MCEEGLNTIFNYDVQIWSLCTYTQTKIQSDFFFMPLQMKVQNKSGTFQTKFQHVEEDEWELNPCGWEEI